VLLCAIPLSLPIADPDLWGHVQYAEDWLREGALPRTATHTFTAVNHPWINHENLAELALAGGFRIAGVAGLLIGKLALGLLLLLLILRQAQRQHVATPVICAVLGLVTLSLHVFWLLRPQLATFVGITLMVLVLDRAFLHWHTRREVTWRWLWLYPAIQGVWTNAHGGFLAGYLLFATYLAGRATELVWSMPSPRNSPAPHQNPRKTLAMLAAVAIATGCTMLLNPYGFRLVLWLLGALSAPRPEIIEWGKPDLLAPMFIPYFTLLLLTIAAWVATDRRRDWVHAALLALTAWQSLSHIRHIGLFVVLTGFLSLQHIQALWEAVTQKWTRLKPASSATTSDLRRPRFAVLGAAALLVSIGTLPVVAQRVAWLRVDRQAYPVDAIRFIQDHRITGRLVVSFNWAQYAIAALQPEVQVAFDGRFRTCYPQEIIDQHFDFLLGEVPGRFRSDRSGPVDPERALNEGSPDLVLLDRSFPHSVEVMNGQTEFVLLYQDGTAQLWGRRTRFDHQIRSISSETPPGHLPWPTPHLHVGVRHRSEPPQ
jgi:hypothetical protein